MNELTSQFGPDGSADAQLLMEKFNLMMDKNSGVSFTHFKTAWLEIHAQMTELGSEPSTGTMVELMRTNVKNPAFDNEHMKLRIYWGLVLANKQHVLNGSDPIPIPPHEAYSWEKFLKDCSIVIEVKPAANMWAVNLKGKRDERADIKAAAAKTELGGKPPADAQKPDTFKGLCFCCGRKNHWSSDCRATSCALCGAAFKAGGERPHSIYVCQGVARRRTRRRARR
jgi:hypothetical protein